MGSTLPAFNVFHKFGGHTRSLICRERCLMRKCILLNEQTVFRSILGQPQSLSRQLSEVYHVPRLSYKTRFRSISRSESFTFINPLIALSRQDCSCSPVLVSGPFMKKSMYASYSVKCDDFKRTLMTSRSHLHHAPYKSRTCWKCGGDTNPTHELFFCVCGVVQKPANELTYFDLFLFEKSFEIDVKKLREVYKDTQNMLHPDKFSTKSEQEQYYAEEQSALLNKAYNTLLKPLNRAIYMLELEDITIDENDRHSDPEFLMEIMTTNENLSMASSPQEIDQLDKVNDEKINEFVEHLSEAFKNSNFLDAKNVTIQLRYYTTIQEKIKELRIKSFDWLE